MLARAVLVGLLLAGCQREKTTAGAAPSASMAAQATVAPPAPSKASAESWFAGAWTGKYEASKHRIELSAKVGGLPEWAADDGPRGTGAGTVELVPDASGATSGSMDGPLGPAALEGSFDGDTLAARFYPKNDDRTGFSGVMVARRDGERLVGSLDAATSDGHVARSAKVTLSRRAP
jgi:hypothetical protein